MKNKEHIIKECLIRPDEIRQSFYQETVLLFYLQQNDNRYCCVVVEKLSEKEGMILTAYFTKAIKRGDLIWHQ